MRISSDQYGTLPFQPVAMEYTGMEALQTQEATCPFGHILQQSFRSPYFILHCFYLNIKEAHTLHFSSQSAAAIKSQFCLQDTMVWRLNNQEIVLGKDQFIIFHGAIKTISLQCLPQERYRFVALDYPLTALHRLKAHSPDLDEFLGRQVAFLAEGRNYAGHASNHILQLLSGITSRQLPSLLQSPWLQNKLAGLLIELLVELYNRSQPESKRTAMDDICRQAHDLILENISQHFTITQLAKHFRINELYLKTVFKKNYGTGLYEFLQTERMNHARQLLLTTDMPIKEISSNVGFEFTSNFMTAFSLHFGYSPGSLRRKK